ncbi:MAG: AGE family epimerase/isomerase, partial [Gammaproteobacteria bacterium]|nr:AGE family epimerase/isomerase [Gammaproteobacteria bacterium]
MPHLWLSENHLRTQIKGVLDFYQQYAIRPEGGFYQQLDVHGNHDHSEIHHLVSSTRIVVNFARGMMVFDQPEYADQVRHGLAFIRNQHRWADGKGYHWLLKAGQAQDSDQYCYGYAFLMLAYANALQAGIREAGPWLRETFDLMEAYFWQAEYGLYADQRSADLLTLHAYRGQNANMHACEALIAAYEATAQSHYLERALLLADKVVISNTQTTYGLLWEHYDQHWQVDWDYNRQDPHNLYKPWGYQPGHFTEWSKLLLMLHAHRPAPWLVERAHKLLQIAWQTAWDQQYGGLYYGFDPDYRICDKHKYFWVQAETLAALAWLINTTQHTDYQQAFAQLAAYIDQHFIVP